MKRKEEIENAAKQKYPYEGGTKVLDEKLKSAIDKLFEEAQNGDDKAGRILCQIFNETLYATMRCQLWPPMNIIRFDHKIGKKG